ncbi:MAG TPA: alpha/beta fold hydrolase [Acidimicrobiales bacterium]|nr:alpha/beta fold hydrolase [Acidimicrobiales bacterium]
MVAFMRLLSCLLVSCFIAMSCGGNSPLDQTSVSGNLTNQISETTMTTTLPLDEVRVERIQYGDGLWNAGNLQVPPGDGPFPVLVFIHGGFWKAGFNETLMTGLADDAVNKGVATWNFDYRAVGIPGGGYPGTLEDVANAIDHLTELDEPLDLDDVTFVGHSAGGHLALWAAGRSDLNDGDPGSNPRVLPHTVVAQAAVVDLYVAAEQNLGGGAVQSFLGGEPDEVPENYRVATPGSTDARIIAVHGRYDLTVPISQSDFLTDAEGIFNDTATHFDILNPRHDLWLRTLAALNISSDPESISENFEEASPAVVEIPDNAIDYTGQSEVSISIDDNSFSDRFIMVSPGTNITWTNTGRNRHNVTPSLEEGELGWFTSLNESLFDEGGSASSLFEQTGYFPYFCTFHGTATRGQTGQIFVVSD